MIETANLSTGIFSVKCDIPGCRSECQVQLEPAFARRGAWRDLVNSARANAVNVFKWFFERMEVSDNEVLTRDICPFHAPAYRRMLDARNARKGQHASQ